MARCSRLSETLRAVWDALKVNLDGQYSLQRLRASHEYIRSASLAWAVLVLVLTPLPCLLAAAFADSIPLQPPEDGLKASTGFWLRAAFATEIYSHTIVDQIRYYVPQLGMSMRDRFSVSLPTTVLTVALCVALASSIGFPVPFAVLVVSVPWSLFLVCMLWLARGNLLREQADVFRDLTQYSVVVACQLSLVLIYPLFYAAFTSLSAAKQTKFVLLLPVIKRLEKKLFCSVLVDRDDSKPELVIFNVELFNALFVTFCMQTSRSIQTNVVLIVVDFLQASLSLYKLNKVVVDVNQLAVRLNIRQDEVIEKANSIVALDPLVAEHPRLRQFDKRGAFRRGRRNGVLRTATTTRVLPLTPISPDAKVPDSRLGVSIDSIATVATIAPSYSDSVTLDERVEFVEKVTQMLFLTESMLLVEFTEVMIPVVYGIYLCVLFYLPSRVYYPQLSSMTDDGLQSTITSVFSYAIVELVSFVLLAGVLKLKLRFSAVHQLAFVLETQCRMVQSKLILWVVLTLQSTLVHLGADYTFRFKWLHATSQP